MKAFHVSCARDGSSQGIVFNVLRDVEKEVLVIDGTQRPPSSDGSGDSQVLKSVKKTEAEVLCPQHNPVRIRTLERPTSSHLISSQRLGNRCCQARLQAG